VKIPKLAAKRHKAALELVRASRRLTLPEREQVLADFHEGAEHMNGLAGAFFTPPGLARDFAIEVPESGTVLDLCAGIGMLTDAIDHKARKLVCVEMNPAYVEAGRAACPDAHWVNASVFDVKAYEHLGPFDVVISNPPFGAIKADGFEGRYTGGLFEYRVIELASRLARLGVFIVPQESASFRYSGRLHFEALENERARKFREQTGIVMEPNCGIDTATYRADWKGVSPICEIVVCDFSELQAKPATEEPRQPEQLDLLGAA
jgi:hypothetical protein